MAKSIMQIVNIQSKNKVKVTWEAADKTFCSPEELYWRERISLHSLWFIYILVSRNDR